MRKLAEALTQQIKGEVRRDVPLAGYTTLRVGGPAKVMVWPRSEDDLAAVLALASEYEAPLFVMGNGSNLLVSDHGFPGVVVKMECFNDLTFTDEQVNVSAGALLPVLIKQAAKRSLGGLESLWGIPASVGGALAMNAGALGFEISEALLEVRMMDRNGEIKIFPRKKLHFCYRRADIDNRVILGGRFHLRKFTQNAIINALKKAKQKRRDTQPLNQPSAGSIFKNPEGKYAGQLIESAGLKGFCLGGAKISNKHANFIVTSQGAEAHDVEQLIALVKEKVAARFGVCLEEEVMRVG